MHIHRRLFPVLALLSLAAPALAGDGIVAPAQNAPPQNAPPQTPPPQNAPPQTAPPQTAPPAEAPTAQETPQKKLIKAQFKVLRFQEDWSYLGDPNVESDLWLPEIKWIELADGWNLTAGGQFRWREENQVNKNLLGNFAEHNSFSLIRERVFADLHIDDDFRFYVEGINASEHGNTSSDPPPASNARDNWDYLDLFVDLLAPDFYLRLGRFQMAYGKERVIGVGDWANVSRSWQGGLISIKSTNMVTDAFFTHPVIIEPRSADKINASQHFSGVYNTWKLNDSDVLDGYLLALNDDDDVVVAGNGNPGSLNVYTLGTRFAGKSGSIDWDGEVAAQGGNSSNDTIRAWMWSIASGYTMSDLPGVPRVALDVDVASGDSDPTDGGEGTYNQLFPSTHPFFGYMDLVGRQNIISVIPNVRWQLGDTAWFRAAWCDFNLQNRHDSLYNAQGVATLTDNTGNSGNHVGQEWDFTLGIKPSFLAPHSEFLFGYSYFNPGDFVENTGGGDRPQLFYMQYTFNF
jgi:Alginate export